MDDKTRLYYQSPRYVFSFLETELHTGKMGYPPGLKGQTPINRRSATYGSTPPGYHPARRPPHEGAGEVKRGRQAKNTSPPPPSEKNAYLRGWN